MRMLMLLADVDWKAELFKRLDALAEKLGTTGAYLWSVLVRQGVAQGAVDAGTAVALATFATVLMRWVIVNWKAWKADDYDHCAATVLGASVAVVAFLAALSFARDGVVELINPGYYALEKVLEIFGK